MDFYEEDKVLYVGGLDEGTQIKDIQVDFMIHAIQGYLNLRISSSCAIIGFFLYLLYTVIDWIRRNFPLMPST